MRPPDHRQWCRIGLAGVVVAFVGLGSLYAATVPKFLPADETSHVGYALVVGRGDLPRLDTRVPDEIPGLALQYEVRREIYTANHPPLFYLPTAVPLRAGVASGHPVLGLELARLLSVAMTAVAGVAVWWTARVLLPRRPEVAVLAAALTLLLPAVPRFAGVVYNDGFSMAVAAMAVLAGTRVLVLGPSPRRLAAAAAAAAALTLTRAVGIPASLLVAGTVALAMLVHDPRPVGRRLVRAATVGALVVLAAALSSGWFWLRSRHLYGDLTGSDVNLARFGYGPRGSTAELLRDPQWMVKLARQLWGRVYDTAEYAVGRWALPGLAVVGLTVVGALRLVVDAARHRSGSLAATWRSWSPTERGRTLAWPVLAAWVGLLYVSTVSYIASGGGIHGRYLLPGLPAAALLAATAIAAVPPRRWGWAPALCVAILVATGLQWAARLADQLQPNRSWWGAAMTRVAADANGVPAPAVWAPVGLALLGGLVAAASLIALARGREEPEEPVTPVAAAVTAS